MMSRAQAMRKWTTTTKAMMIVAMLFLLAVWAFFISTATENNNTLVSIVAELWQTFVKNAVYHTLVSSDALTHIVLLVSTLYISLVDFKQPPSTREPSASSPVVETTKGRAEH
jgi:hypothetical protein